MKKVAFYGRYSSANQTEQSIEGQLHVCQRYAAQNDLEIVAEYVDRAISGTSDKRPQFQQMIADSAAGKWEHILVYKLDRFARNRYDSAIYKKKLRDQGVTVLSATEAISDTPEGIIMEALLEGMDEYYSAELARKMHRGLQESFSKGKFINPCAPYGYTVVNHALTIDDTRAEIAAEIFRRYAAGERFRDILAWLHGAGIRNGAGNEWSASNLSTMLRNRLYIGEYRRSGMEGVNTVPAIVSEEVFEVVQNRLDESAKRKREGRSDFNYLLSGVLFCKCGKRMYAQPAGNYHYYRCKDCRRSIRAEQLHDRVKAAIAEYLSEDKLEQLARAAYDSYAAEQAPDTAPAVKEELADIEKQLQNAVQAILDGFANDALKDKMNKLEARKSELEDILANASEPAPQLAYEHFLLTLQVMIEKAAEAEDMKQLIAAVVNRIILKDDQAIICINLTNEENDPPLDQILVNVEDS